jgi:magnesium-transporting ATPase (P-type)
MDWKEFFKPQLSKIIVFISLILIFGIPTFVTQCATYDFGRGDFPCGEPKFTLNNPVLSSITTSLDAVDTYEYNIFLVIVYLILLYFILSFIYFNTSGNKKRRIFYTIIFTILFILLRIWISIL